MDRIRTRLFLRVAAGGIALATAVAACSSAGATASPSDATASPSDAMMEASASPDAMMEASASPDAMMEASASPDAMMEASASPDAMAQGGRVSIGSFHAVDGTASGTAALFHRADGTFVITFEDFSIASPAHTDVILVPNKDVKADGDIDRTTIVDLGPVKGTAGMQDYVVPASADAMTYHAVVLWDTEMAHAIAAAPLQ
jgi:acyl CoA:acetate/3-ketoacid CoA transferase beta subunit